MLLLCMAAGPGTAQAGLADAGAKETRSSSEQPLLQHDSSAERRTLEASAGLRDVEADFKPPSGYKQKSLNGKTVYCNKERISGTRSCRDILFYAVTAASAGSTGGRAASERGRISVRKRLEMSRAPGY